MGMLTNLIDRVLQASWKRVGERRSNEAPQLLARTVDGPPTGLAKSFIIHDAMNGKYIEFVRRKYNPHGPDEYQREIYIVQPDEALIDAISTVLVLLEK